MSSHLSCLLAPPQTQSFQIENGVIPSAMWSLPTERELSSLPTGCVPLQPCGDLKTTRLCGAQNKTRAREPASSFTFGRDCRSIFLPLQSFRYEIFILNTLKGVLTRQDHLPIVPER